MSIYKQWDAANGIFRPTWPIAAMRKKKEKKSSECTEAKAELHKTIPVIGGEWTMLEEEKGWGLDGTNAAREGSTASTSFLGKYAVLRRHLAGNQKIRTH